MVQPPPPSWFDALTDPEFRTMLGTQVDGGAAAAHANPYPQHPQSFRSRCRLLPFAVRFQLERHLLNNDAVEVRVKKPPPGRQHEKDRAWHGCCAASRRLVHFFLHQIVPTLAEVDWETFVQSTPNGRCITFAELAAWELGPRLKAVKLAMKRGVPPVFDRQLVADVIERAKRLLQAAEAQHGLSEAQLQTGFATGLDRFVRHFPGRFPPFRPY